MKVSEEAIYAISLPWREVEAEGIRLTCSSGVCIITVILKAVGADFKRTALSQFVLGLSAEYLCRHRAYLYLEFREIN